MASPYKPDEIMEDVSEKRAIIDVAVDVQVILQILINKEIITEEELNTWRKRVRNFPKYKSAYEMLDKMTATANLYKNDPEAYLKALMEAKLKGHI